MSIDSKKDIIIKDVMDIFEARHPGVHNKIQHSKCVRDTGYNFDALVHDLYEGGITKTLKVAGRYWSGATSFLPKADRKYALEVNRILEKRINKELSLQEDKDKIGFLIKIVNEIVEHGFGYQDIKQVLKRRTNLRFFQVDRYPDKETIEELLYDAHKLVPYKNNIPEHNIKIYGPEHYYEKKELVLHTVAGRKEAGEFNKYGMNQWRPKGKHEGDFKLLKSLYDEWRERQLKGVNRGLKGKTFGGLLFNEQVRAPYLLVYTQRLRRPTDKQKEQAYPSDTFGYTKLEDETLNWYISAAMHGIGMAWLANNKGIDASFCKCFFYDKTHPNKILEPIKYGDSKKIAFMLGLGFEDQNYGQGYRLPESKLEEYVEWE